VDALLEQKLHKLGERLKQKRGGQPPAPAAATSAPEVAEPPPPQALVIPFRQPWAEALRAAPLALLRSALFGVVRRGRRQYLNEVEIAVWPGISIYYKGEQLDQADQDVWMQAVHLFRHLGLGERLCLSAYSFLKAIGRSTGKHNIDWLKRSFTRMVACALVIKVGRCTYVGNLVQEFWLDERTGKYVLSINPRLADLFREGYSLIEWEQRQALGSKNLAKWLLGYVATHQATTLKPHFIGLDKLQRLCGSDMKGRDFKYWTRHYMAELQALGAVASWCLDGVDGDVLKFIRPPEKASRKSRKRQ
jgi:hypothetical protein